MFACLYHLSVCRIRTYQFVQRESLDVAPDTSSVRLLAIRLSVCVFTCTTLFSEKAQTLLQTPVLFASLQSICLSVYMYLPPCSTLKKFRIQSKHRFCSSPCHHLPSVCLSVYLTPCSTIRKFRIRSKHRFCSSPCHPSVCLSFCRVCVLNALFHGKESRDSVKTPFMFVSLSSVCLCT